MEILGEKHKFWFDAIKHDDVETASRTISSVGGAERTRYLNGRFEFNAATPNGDRKVPHRFARPFNLAAIFGSLGVCDVMIQNGVDVHSRRGEEIQRVSLLVCVACWNPDQEEEVVKTYQGLCQLLPACDLLDLMRGEQEDGLRPMEFAAQHKTFKLMSVMFETSKLYLIREEIVGISIYRWHDVSDYLFANQQDSRHFVSPIGFLTRISRRDLHSGFVNNLLKKGIMHDWIRKTIAWKRFGFYTIVFQTLVCLILLFLYRDDAALLKPVNRMSMTESLASHYNVTERWCSDSEIYSFSDASSYFMQSSLLLCVAGLGSFMFLSLIRGFIRYKTYNRMVNSLGVEKQKSLLAYDSLVRYYNALSFFGSLLVEIAITNYFVAHPSETTLEFLNLMRLSTDMSGLWTFRSYLRHFPVIGRMNLYLEKTFIHYGMLLNAILVVTALFARVLMLFFNNSSSQDA